MYKDYDLQIFSHAMEILVNASKLRFDPYDRANPVTSIGVDGYGNVDTLDRLAGALNFKGYRTRTGKYIRGNYLKQIKHSITQKYGKEFVSDIVAWEQVSTPILTKPQKSKKTIH
jgi:hypothetical protein